MHLPGSARLEPSPEYSNVPVDRVQAPVPARLQSVTTAWVMTASMAGHTGHTADCPVYMGGSSAGPARQQASWLAQ